MKRKYLIAGAITMAAFITGIALMFAVPGWSSTDSITVYRHEVDPTKEITLDLKAAKVSFNEWGKNYVEIAYDNLLDGKNNMKIIAAGNNISLESKLDFSGYRHIHVNVPKSAVNITADVLQAKSGTFKSIKAERAIIRYCSMADGFVSEGKELEIRESIFKGNGTIKNEEVSMRECDVNNVVFSPEGKTAAIFTRQTGGMSMRLDAKGCDTLNVEMADLSLDKFAVDYEGDKGTIIFMNCKVKNIENNSKLVIKKKSNIFQ